MLASYALALSLLLTSCLMPNHSIQTIQPMPSNSAGVRAGCIRTLARLALDSNMGQFWSLGDAAIYCDEIERSFQDEIRMSKVQRT